MLSEIKMNLYIFNGSTKPYIDTANIYYTYNDKNKKYF